MKNRSMFSLAFWQFIAGQQGSKLKLWTENVLPLNLRLTKNVNYVIILISATRKRTLVLHLAGNGLETYR